MARVCVITQNPAWGGGVLTKLQAFLAYASSRKHVCDLYFPSSSDNSTVELLRQHKSVRNVFPVHWYEKLPDCIRSTWFARNCRIAGKYDAYQLVAGGLHQGLPFARQGLSFVAWIASTYMSDVSATTRSNFKQFLMYNMLTNMWAERLEMESAEKALVIAPVSNFSKSQLMSRYGIAEEKLVVLPVPVKLAIQSEISEKETHRYILSVGQLQRRKDFPTLLRAFRTVRESIVDIELHVVGEGKELSNLIRLTKELGLTDSVKFLGFLSAEELLRQYHHATLFALASRQEGLGIVFIEAMSTGLPVVATDCGGSADPILDGVTGILSPVGDDHSLAQNIILLLQDSTMRRRMCDAARSRAVEEYSSEKIFTKLDKIYEHVFGI